MSKPLTPEESTLWRNKSKDLMDLILGQYREPAPPVEEEKVDPKAKKDVKPAANAKKDSKAPPPPVVEVKPVVIEPPKIPIEPKKIVEKDNRFVIDLPVVYNHTQLNNEVAEFVPEPLFPDPEKEPVPEPILHQIIRKPTQRNKLDPIKNFVILTPKGNYINDTEGDNIDLTKSLEETTISNQARWIIPSKKKCSLYVKFFTKVTGQFDSLLDFESFFSIKKYQVPV